MQLIKGNISVTIMGNKLKIVEYICEGKSPFEKWFNSLDAVSAAKVSSALYKLELGNLSNVKSVGRGVMEYRVHFGPGYRVYFGREGDKIIIILGGGIKRTQNKDINKAHALWLKYKIERIYKGQ